MTEQDIPINTLRAYQKTLVTQKNVLVWQEALPDLSLGTINTLIEQFVTRGATSQQMDDLASHVGQMNYQHKDDLSQMVAHQFKPEQIHLFVTSSPDERRQLSAAWEQGLIKRAKQLAHTAPTAIGTATTVFAAGGAVTCLGFIGMGLITQDPNLADTGKSILGALVDPEIGLQSSGWTWPTLPEMIDNAPQVSAGIAFVLIGAKAAASVIGELSKDDPQDVIAGAKRDLQDRVAGVFQRLPTLTYPTVQGPVSEDDAQKKLDEVKDAYLPLLSHLEPKELITFLVADDEGREEMMRIHPPQAEQKIETTRALHDGTMRRSWETARQSLTAWEGTMAKGPAVTLKSALLAFRASKAPAPAVATARPSAP